MEFGHFSDPASFFMHTTLCRFPGLSSSLPAEFTGLGRLFGSDKADLVLRNVSVGWVFQGWGRSCGLRWKGRVRL